MPTRLLEFRSLFRVAIIAVALSYGISVQARLESLRLIRWARLTSMYRHTCSAVTRA